MLSTVPTAQELQLRGFVTPNVRVKSGPTAWRAGRQAQNGPQAQRLMAGVPRCLGLGLNEGLGVTVLQTTLSSWLSRHGASTW